MERRERRAPRRDVTYQVWIAYGEERRVVPCTLNNVSQSGARLTMPFNGDVPEEFEMILSQSGRGRRRCKVVWRSTLEIGVRFES
jgi:hypothetical protein